MRARGRRVLLVALAISLLLHLLLAGYWYWPSHTESEAQLSNVRIVQITHRPPPPVQTPAPKPVQTPRIATKAHSKIAPPQIASHNGPNARRGPVTYAPQTPRPVGTATPARVAAGCTNPNAGPAVSATPDTPDIAAAARASRITGVVAIDVSLDPAGNVTDAKVARSIGNDGLDASALTMARNASYTPKYTACKGVASTYTFTVKFVAW
ncbi:MAG TPA: TonB family protein [Candidatus Rubrimentiphilum sp.]|nr:TonB family protein [Candidatus Rubrimentiphilum sp.]